MTEMNGKVYMFCGDTFSSEKNSDWRSNVLFIIEDDDPSDGLTITGTASDKWGRSKECLVNSSGLTVGGIGTAADQSPPPQAGAGRSPASN